MMQYPVCEAMIALASSKDNKNDSQEQEFLPFLTVSFILTVSVICGAVIVPLL